MRLVACLVAALATSSVGAQSYSCGSVGPSYSLVVPQVQQIVAPVVVQPVAAQAVVAQPVVAQPVVAAVATPNYGYGSVAAVVATPIVRHRAFVAAPIVVARQRVVRVNRAAVVVRTRGVNVRVR